MQLSVLMPVINEALTVIPILNRLTRLPLDAEITAKLLSAGHPIYALPVSYPARYENKKRSLPDGFPTLRALWKYRNWKPRTGVDADPA